MLDAIVNEVSPENRALAERSISAAAGALFGVVVASSLGLLSGRAPFALDLPMLTLYASVIPLSIAGFMVRFTRKMPRLPILATLYFTAFFVASVFFGELLFGTGTVSLAGATIALKKFVGFRVIGAAALAGLLFRITPASGFRGDAEPAASSETRADWEARHQEAIQRLAMVDVDIRQQRSQESAELEAFERRLLSGSVEDVVLDLDEGEESEETEEKAAVSPELAAA